MDAETVERVYDAYQTGLLRQPAGSPAQPSFSRLMMHSLHRRFSLRERLAFRTANRASQQGLAAARRGDLQIAAERFAACREILDRHRPGEACRLLATSFLEAAEAYLEYRHGRYERARERIAIVLEADLALESDEAFAILHMHRVQAADNLMMIDLRAGLKERALLLAGSIVAYAEGLADSIPVHHSWRPRVLGRMPATVRRGAMGMIANEIAYAFPTCPAPEVWDAFAAPLALHLDRPFAVHPQVRQWLLVRRARVEGDDERFLSRVSEMLAEGRDGLGPVWYTVLLDLVELTRDRRTENGDALRRALLRDSKWWPDMPPAFRPLLRKRRRRAQASFPSSSAQRS